MNKDLIRAGAGCDNILNSFDESERTNEKYFTDIVFRREGDIWLISFLRLFYNMLNLGKFSNKCIKL